MWAYLTSFFSNSSTQNNSDITIEFNPKEDAVIVDTIESRNKTEAEKERQQLLQQIKSAEREKLKKAGQEKKRQEEEHRMAVRKAELKRQKENRRFLEKMAFGDAPPPSEKNSPVLPLYAKNKNTLYGIPYQAQPKPKPHVMHQPRKN